MRKALSLTLIATMLSLPVAQAKNRDKAWEFAAMATNVDGDKDADIENGVGATLMLGYNFSAKLEAELSLTTNTVDFSAVDDALTALLEIPEADLENGRVEGPIPEREDSFLRAVLQITGNFLTDRETRFVPYISAGLGVIQETRDAFPVAINYVNPADPNGLDPNIPNRITIQQNALESFDSSAILSLSVGARTFFSDNWGIRYEVRYNHHDSFDASQDEYQITAGVTWVVGGQK